MHTYQRDGFMRFDDNGGDGPNYWPNSFGGPAPRAEMAPPPFAVEGQAARHKYEHPNDDFVQAGALYRQVMNEEERTRLVGNLVAHMSGATADPVPSGGSLLRDAEYGTRRRGLG